MLQVFVYFAIIDIIKIFVYSAQGVFDVFPSSFSFVVCWMETKAKVSVNKKNDNSVDHSATQDGHHLDHYRCHCSKMDIINVLCRCFRWWISCQSTIKYFCKQIMPNRSTWWLKPYINLCLLQRRWLRKQKKI